MMLSRQGGGNRRDVMGRSGFFSIGIEPHDSDDIV